MSTLYHTIFNLSTIFSPSPQIISNITCLDILLSKPSRPTLTKNSWWRYRESNSAQKVASLTVLPIDHPHINIFWRSIPESNRLFQLDRLAQFTTYYQQTNFIFSWLAQLDLNQRLPSYQDDTLPTELYANNYFFFWKVLLRNLFILVPSVQRVRAISGTLLQGIRWCERRDTISIIICFGINMFMFIKMHHQLFL